MAKRNKNNKDNRLKQLGLGAGAVVAVGALGAGGVKVKNVLRAKKAAKDAAVSTAAKQAGGKVSKNLVDNIDSVKSSVPVKSPVSKTNASNVGGFSPKPPSSPLVAAPVQVKGYNRGGKYITPYSATRKKASGTKVSIQDIQRSRVQDVPSTAGTLSGAAITDGYTSTKTLARQASDRRQLQTMGGALAATSSLVELSPRQYNSLRVASRRKTIAEDPTLNNLLQTANKSRRRVIAAERASRATETYLDVRKSNTSTVVSQLLARAKKDIAVTKNAYRKLKNRSIAAKQGVLVPAAFRPRQPKSTSSGFRVRPKSAKNMSQRQRDIEVSKSASSELRRRVDKLKGQGRYSSYTCAMLINF